MVDAPDGAARTGWCGVRHDRRECRRGVVEGCTECAEDAVRDRRAWRVTAGPWCRVRVGTSVRRCTSVTKDRRRMSRTEPRGHTVSAGRASGQSSGPGRRGARLAGGRWEEDRRAGRCECGNIDVRHHRDQLLSLALWRVRTGRDISGSFTSNARGILRSSEIQCKP